MTNEKGWYYSLPEEEQHKIGVQNAPEGPCACIKCLRYYIAQGRNVTLPPGFTE